MAPQKTNETAFSYAEEKSYGVRPPASHLEPLRSVEAIPVTGVVEVKIEANFTCERCSAEVPFAMTVTLAQAEHEKTISGIPCRACGCGATYTVYYEPDREQVKQWRSLGS